MEFSESRGNTKAVLDKELYAMKTSWAAAWRNENPTSFRGKMCNVPDVVVHSIGETGTYLL